MVCNLLTNKLMPTHVGEYYHDRLNDDVYYEGYARCGSLSNQPVWMIRRVVVSGAITQETWAGLGSNQMVWDNRYTYFDDYTTPTYPISSMKSVYFDGVNDTLLAPVASMVPEGSAAAWTLSFWVKRLGDFEQYDTFFDNRNDDGNIGKIIQNAGRHMVIRWYSDYSKYIYKLWKDVVVTSSWVHYVITYAGTGVASGLTLYVNGVEYVGGEVYSDTLEDVPSASNYKIGTGNPTTFNGYMDEIVAYDKALNATEVSELYNSGIPTNPRNLSTADNLWAWYAMGDGDSYPVITNYVGESNITMLNMLSTNITLEVPG